MVYEEENHPEPLTSHQLPATSHSVLNQTPAAIRHFDVIVIGAGHNGLTAAAYLARAGKRVLVLERRDVIGGACTTEEIWPGYRVSTGAYLCSLLQPQIVHDLELEKYGLEIYARTTSGFAPFSDGSYLFLYPDELRTRHALSEFCQSFPEDSDAYFAFEDEIAQAAAIVEPWLLQPPLKEETRRAAFRIAGLDHLYTPFMEGSVRDLLEARFKNPRLKGILATDGLIGTYGGPSTPGTAYVLLHHYLGRILGSYGSWGYVRGGMGRITQALAASCETYGGIIRTGAEVVRLDLEPDEQEGARIDRGDGSNVAGANYQGYRCNGVVLSSGEVIKAPIVLSNADPFHTFEVLVAGAESTRLSDLQPSGDWQRLRTQGGASAKINLAVTELPRFTCLRPEPGETRVGAEHLGTIHIGSELDNLERAWAEAARGYPSTEPMIEIYLQTATDPTLAPPGRHILSLFVQYFPYNLAPGLDLDFERERFADRVIAMIGRHAPNVPDSILHRQILTPRDLEARFGLTGGHIFHGDLLPPDLWDHRPNYRPEVGFSGPHTPVKNLYLCGSGANPGGCVSGAPGYNAAQAVLNAS